MFTEVIGGAPCRAFVPVRKDLPRREFLSGVGIGNYRVTVTVGDREGETTTTVKAELRRLMLARIHSVAGPDINPVRCSRAAEIGKVHNECPSLSR